MKNPTSTTENQTNELEITERNVAVRALPMPPYTAAGVTLADMFDEEFYLANGLPEFRAYFKTPGAISPWQHYLNNKNVEPFRSPCRWFDPAVYFKNYPEVEKAIKDGKAGAGINSAIDHFIKWGQFENRDASPWFSHQFYLTTYPDVVDSFSKPYASSAIFHFIKAGLREGRSPSLLMSGADTVNVIAPAVQYTFAGDDTLKLYPNPNANLSDAVRVHGGKGKNLYIVQPGKGAITMADFDPSKDKIDLKPMGYILFSDLPMSQQGSDTVIYIPNRTITLKNVLRSAVTIDQFVGLFAQGVGVTIRDLVDPDYYKAYNPGVAESGWDPVEHYVKWGQFNRNLRPSRWFNPNYYLQQNPLVEDAVNADPNNYSAALHYVLYGQYGENRRPSEEFDPVYYLNTYTDVKNKYDMGLITPYKHFHDNGLREDRYPAPPKPAGTVVQGTDKADALYGTGQGNLFKPEKGSNVMHAIGHPNTYVITPDASTDTIYGFDARFDKIEIKDELVHNFSDLVITTQGEDTLIRFGEKRVILNKVTPSVLSRLKNFPSMYFKAATLEDLVNPEYYADYNPGVTDSIQTPLTHYLWWGKDNNNLRPSRFFDPVFYLNKYPDVKADVDAGKISAAMHFILYGQYKNLQPSADFDPKYYLDNNPLVKNEVESRGITAFRHFIEYGFFERRWCVAPKQTQQTVSGNDKNDVLYGVSKEGDKFILGKGNNSVYPMGTKNTYVISPDDTGTTDTIHWYNPATDKIDISKLNIHNIAGVTVTGVVGGTKISIIGPVKSKIILLKDLPVQQFSLTQLSGVFTLALGAEELFDAVFYVKKYPEVAKSGLDPYTHFQQFGKAKNYHPSIYFDPDYYLGTNPGLEEALAELGITAFDHYIQDGQYELFRNPTQYFNTTYYAEHNPGVLEAQTTPIRHFKLWGKSEFFRNPSEIFNTEYYLENNPDALSAYNSTGILPFEHYVTIGRYRDYIPSIAMKGNLLIKGTYRKSELFGSAGVTSIEAGKAPDSLYLGIGTATATGGEGIDRFYISPKPGKKDIITDFNPDIGEKIVVSRLSHIETFDDLKISQQGADTFIDLGAGQSLVLKNVKASKLNSTHFYCALSAIREVNIYSVANKLQSVLDTIEPATKPEFLNTLRADFKKFTITDYSTNNPQNQSINKRWNKIDLSFFGLNQVIMTQRGSSVIVDLGQSAELEILNVKLSDLHPTRNFILSAGEGNAWRAEMTKDWDSNDPYSIVPIKALKDDITHDDEKIIYQARPTMVRITNTLIPTGNPTLRLFKVPVITNGKQYVINNFNPDNPYQMIDLSELGINTFDDLGIAVKGYDTIINTKNGSSIVLKNTNPNKLSASNFTGFLGPIESRMSIYPVAAAGDVTFDVKDAEAGTEIIVDFTDVPTVQNYSDLTITQNSSDTLIIVKTTGQKITFKNALAAYFTSDKFVSYSKDAFPAQNSGKRDTTTLLNTDNLLSNFDRRFSDTYIRANVPDNAMSSSITPPSSVIVINRSQYEAAQKQESNIADIVVGNTLTVMQEYLNLHFDSALEDTKRGLEGIKANPAAIKALKLATSTGPLTAISFLWSNSQAYNKNIKLFKEYGFAENDIHQLAATYSIADSVLKEVASYIGGGVGGTAGFVAGLETGPGALGTGFAGAVVGSVEAQRQYSLLISPLVEKIITFSQTGFFETKKEWLENPTHRELINQCNVNKRSGSCSILPDLLGDDPFSQSLKQNYQLSLDMHEGEKSVFYGQTVVKQNGQIVPVTDNDSEVYAYPSYDPEADNPIPSAAAWSIFVQSTPNGERNYYQGKLYQRVDNQMLPAVPDDNDLEYRNPLEVNPIKEVATILAHDLIDMTEISGARFNQIGNNFRTMLQTSGYAQVFANMALGDVEFEENAKILVEAFVKQELHDLAMKEVKNLATTQIGKDLQFEKIVAQNLTPMQAFAKSLVLMLGEALIAGKITAETVGPQVAMFAASYGVQVAATAAVAAYMGGTEAAAAAATAATNALNAAWASGSFSAYLTALPAAIGPQIIIFIAVAVVMKVFGDDVMKAYEVLKDIVKGFWDFLGDPINDLDDLWDKIRDDKWTYRIGSEGPDIMRSDSLWERIKLLGGNDIGIGFNGWNIFFGDAGNDILIGGLGTLNANGNLYYDELYGGLGDDFLIGRGTSPKINFLVGGPGSNIIIDGAADSKLYACYRTNDDGSPNMNNPYPQTEGPIGNNILSGGRGTNFYYLCTGKDRVIITPHAGTTDTIYNFDPSTEVIDVSRIGDADWEYKRFHNLVITAKGSDTVVDFPGQKRVVLKNIAPQQLNVKHFLGTRIALTLDDLFDANYYKSHYNVPNGVDPKQHFISVGKKLKYNPSIFFDTEMYLSKNEDVKKAVDKGDITAIDHFIKWGQDEDARDPGAFFSNQYYSKMHPEVAKNSYVPLKHYIDIGRFQGFKPSENYNSVGGLPVVTPAPTLPRTSAPTSLPTVAAPSPSTGVPITTVRPSTAAPVTGSTAPSTAAPVTGSTAPSTAAPVAGSVVPSTAAPVAGSAVPSTAVPVAGSVVPSTAAPVAGSAVPSTAVPVAGSTAPSTAAPVAGSAVPSTAVPVAGSTAPSTAVPEATETPVAGSTSPVPSTGTSPLEGDTASDTITSGANYFAPWFDGMGGWISNLFVGTPIRLPVPEQALAHDLEVYRDPTPANQPICVPAYHGEIPILNCQGDGYTVRVMPKMQPVEEGSSTFERVDEGPYITDSYKNCKAGEFYGRQAVYCEGERTTVVYTEPRSPLMIDHVSGQAALLGVGWHLIKKTYALFTKESSKILVKSAETCLAPELTGELSTLMAALEQADQIIAEGQTSGKLSLSQAKWLQGVRGDLFSLSQKYAKDGLTGSELNLLASDVFQLNSDISESLLPARAQVREEAHTSSMQANHNLLAAANLPNLPPQPAMPRQIAAPT